LRTTRVGAVAAGVVVASLLAVASTPLSGTGVGNGGRAVSPGEGRGVGGIGVAVGFAGACADAVELPIGSGTRPISTQPSAWIAVSQPEAFPTYALAASPDGGVVGLGVSDGLLRSEDGGSTWTTIELPSPAFAITLADDGRTTAVVTKATDFYRSNDGGRSWPGP
jgi:hypothetical protein